MEVTNPNDVDTQNTQENKSMGYFNFSTNTGLTQNIAEGFSEMIKSSKAPFKITVFDKTKYPEHSYDHILITYVKNNITYGYIFLIAASGKGGVNMNEFITAFKQQIPVFLPSKTMEGHLISVMKQAMGIETLVVVGQVNYNTTDISIPVLGNVLERACNTLAEEAGDISPNTINDRLQYSLNMRHHNEPMVNVFNMPKATSWSASVTNIQNSNVNHPNKLASSGTLIEASGIVDMLTTRSDERTPTGIVQVANTRPIVQLNRVASDGQQKQGVTQALLGLVIADIMSARSNWVLPVLNSPYNVGALEKHYGGKVLKLNDNSLPMDKRRLELDKLVTQNAMTCLSVDDLSLEGGPMAKFVALGLGNAKAGADIINAAHKLTNGIFPTNYPVDRIVTTIVSLPSGTFVDNNNGEVKDLGELTQPFFLNADTKNGLSYAFRYCQIISGEVSDSFSNMINLLSDTVGANNITLNGSRALIYLDSEFLKILISSMNRAGLTPKFDDMLESGTMSKLAAGTGLSNAIRNHDGFQPSTFGGTPNYGGGGNFAIGGAIYK